MIIRESSTSLRFSSKEEREAFITYLSFVYKVAIRHEGDTGYFRDGDAAWIEGTCTYNYREAYLEDATTKMFISSNWEGLKFVNLFNELGLYK